MKSSLKARPKSSNQQNSISPPVKHEKTRASEITGTNYKPDGEGAKDEMTLQSVGHEQPPDKHGCGDTNSLRNSQTAGTPANNRCRKRKPNTSQI
ncbi:hypothetical protein GOBAR_DD28717 [Gossypium barbadense]|nr:hypothetical protein GOBAR_DD28717 [Gossypium barbadense]